MQTNNLLASAWQQIAYHSFEKHDLNKFLGGNEFQTFSATDY
jgi:hypothetical protein